MSVTRLLPVLATLLLLASPLAAAVPGQVSYQGLLLDDQGQPVTGNVDLFFALFDAPSGGSLLWSESHPGVAVLDGVYDVVLGSSTPLTPALVAGGALHLEIEVDGETLAPRQRLVGVPYALRAGEAENLGGTSGAFFTEIVQGFPFDGAAPANDDPREGTGDTDGDGLANFLDADNDDDGLSDADELALGSDLNLVTPTISGLDPPGPVEASITTLVSVQGTNFEPGLGVVFGTETPTPQNVTSTSFDVSVGPQPEGIADVVVTLPNGESSAAASFEFVLTQPLISSLSPEEAPADETALVTVTGSGFGPGLQVSFGSETPTPQNLTSTSFDVSVGPQPAGAADVVVSYPSGKQDPAVFFFVDPQPKLAFVTSTTSTGDLGGLAGADALCNTLAANASLPGSYLAWLSTPSASPDSRFSKTGLYERVDGALVAASYGDLIDLSGGGLINMLNVNEQGNTTSASTAWTATASNGTYDVSAGSCAAWTTDDPETDGGVGLPSSHTAWTDGGVGVCDLARPIYCFEQ